MLGKISLRNRLLVLTILFLVVPPAYPQSTPERINAVYASIAGDHAALYVAQDMESSASMVSKSISVTSPARRR